MKKKCSCCFWPVHCPCLWLPVLLPLIKPPATWPLRKLLKLPKVLAAPLPKPVKVLAAQP